MAEDSPLPGAGYGSQPTARLGKATVTHRVDATIDAKQQPLANPGFDRALAQTEPSQLAAADHAMLAPQQTGQTAFKRRGVGT